MVGCVRERPHRPDKSRTREDFIAVMREKKSISEEWRAREYTITMVMLT